jgi:hypothetical protein
MEIKSYANIIVLTSKRGPPKSELTYRNRRENWHSISVYMEYYLDSLWEESVEVNKHKNN